MPESPARERASVQSAPAAGRTRGHASVATATAKQRLVAEPESGEARMDAAPMVSRVAYDQLEEKLNSTQEMLEDALADHAGE